MIRLLENKDKYKKMKKDKEGEIRITFREKYKYLCKMYHENYDEELCKEYYKYLRKHNAEKILRAMDIAVDTIKFFPTVAEINEIIKNLPPKWFYEKVDKKNPTNQERKLLDDLIAELTKNKERDEDHNQNRDGSVY